MTIQLDDYQKLKHTITNLDAANQQKINDGLNDYSLINAMLRINNEVQLHSRFIYSMLNPNGPHYQGNLFLGLFLSELVEINKAVEGFISQERAVVKREWHNIDLLIHDNNHFIVIENKLNHKDEKHQITRYIDVIKSNFFDRKQSMQGKLIVVYLSKQRSQPAEQSHTGFKFNLENKSLEWKGNEHPAAFSFAFEDGLEVPFLHFPYYPTKNDKNRPCIETWVSACHQAANELPHLNLRNGFEEYQLILNRLNPITKNQRNIMNLAEFIANEKEEEQRTYARCMVVAQTSLIEFAAQKIVSELEHLIPTEKRFEHSSVQNSLNVELIKNWLNRKGSKESYKNVGFAFHDKKGNECLWLLAEAFFYFGMEGQTKKYNAEHGQRWQILNNPTGLFDFLKISEDLIVTAMETSEG